MGSTNLTRKSRSDATQEFAPEPPEVGSPVNGITPLLGMSVSSQPARIAPESSRTVNRAAVHFLSGDPSPGMRKSTHSWMPDADVQAMRGTDTFAGKDTVGDVVVQPTVAVAASHTRICLSSEFVQKHFGLTGSMRTAYTILTGTLPPDHEPPEHQPFVAASKQKTWPLPGQ